MENKIAKVAMDYFDEGFNCAESTLRAYLDAYQKDPAFMSAASGFGGGIGGKGLTCGAVTGGIIAVGLHFNKKKSDQKELAGKIRTASQKILEGFKKKHGSTNCRNLQPYDLTTMSGREKLHNDKEVAAKCKGYICSAAELVEEIIQS